MTLEDFFTLNEMKGGLTTLLRVNELVTVMHKENDSVIKNIGEAARQWSTVATTITATENRQCLDRFIQLDGHCFINKWINYIQNFSSDTGNNVVEESILALLRALEKLQIDSERSNSSGILVTVKNLIGHSNLKIQDSARALFDGWDVVRETDASQQFDQKVEVLQEGGIDVSINGDRDRDSGQCSLVDNSSSRTNGNEEKRVEPSSEEEKLTLDCAATSEPDRVDEERSVYAEKTIADAITENRGQDPVHSKMSNGVDESLPVKEETSVHHSVSRNASQKDNRIDDKGSPNGCKSMPVLDTKEQIEECTTDTSRSSSDDEYKWGETKDRQTFSRVENSEGAEMSEEHSGDQVGNSSKNASDIFKPTTGVKDCNVMSKRSDMELDYDMVDPLEVARQVANEVEREIDCREPSCSTSDKTSGGGLMQTHSPDSTNKKQSQSIEGPCKKLPTLPNPPPRLLPTGLDPVINAETLSVDREHCIYDMASSQVTEGAQKSEANMDKGFSGFDLNQEDCSEDMDRPIQISTPIPVVSVSRPPPASGLPNAPLQFEGALGWKGSAATSAFRRIPESDRSLPMVGSSNNNSGQRLDSFDFDLNVAEGGGEDKIEVLLSGKQILNLSGFPSAEGSSIEVSSSPRRSERVQLDLNHAGDGGVGDGGVDALLDWRRDGRLNQSQNGRQSPSQSSSSSSMQPSLKNFDLNLNHQQFSIQDSSSDHRLFGKSLNASRTASDASIFSLMGTQVEIKGKDSVPQNQGQIVDHSMDLNVGRSGGFLGMGSSIPFTHSPVYGFNNLASGSGMSFCSMYGQPGGPIPYMVDSRGAPVIPQLMASPSSIPPAFSQPTPFMMSMNAVGTSNGAGPSRHNFDLNSGMMIEGGNRETGLGLRQFLNPSQGRSLDDHLGPQQQPLPSTGLGLKRQEPDSGWESYPFNYKHHQPSWK